MKKTSKKTEPQKIVINKCYGGFGISPEAALWLHKHGHGKIATPVAEYFGPTDQADENGLFSKTHALKEWKKYLKSKKKPTPFLTVFSPDLKYVLDQRPQQRDHPLLVKCVEALGTKKSGNWASELKVVEIPTGVKWTIEEYDGREWIAEVHRTWG